MLRRAGLHLEPGALRRYSGLGQPEACLDGDGVLADREIRLRYFLVEAYRAGQHGEADPALLLLLGGGRGSTSGRSFLSTGQKT
jgi:hypothetical protein